MGALTEVTPKPLLEVAGKTLLEHKFDALPNDIDEVVLVVGYYGSMIQKRFGGMYKDKRILYVEQGPIHGTAGALSYAAPVLKDRFLVMMGDDIYSKEDIIQCVAERDAWTMLLADVSEKRTGGSVKVDAKGLVKEIIENHDEGGGTGLINTNMFVLDTRLFDQPLIPKSAGSEEFGLPQTVVAASFALEIPLKAVSSVFWMQITAPEDLQKAEEMLANS